MLICVPTTNLKIDNIQDLGSALCSPPVFFYSPISKRYSKLYVNYFFAFVGEQELLPSQRSFWLD